jgi:hypothetical protein
MFWSTFKIATCSAVVTAAVLGTAVLAQQGRSGSGAPAQQTPAHPPDNAASPALAQVSKPTQQQLIDQKNAHIRSLLSRKLDLDFPDGISLQEYLKEIKRATTSKDDPGIPIYVNPRGIQDAQITLTSRISFTKGQSLGETLRYVLNSTGLSYVVHDGFLMIDSRTGILERRLDEIDRKLDWIIHNR